MNRLACLAFLVLVASSARSFAAPIVQYNPTGAYCGATAVAPVSAAGFSASNLTEVGFPDYCNTNVLPVGPISTSTTIQLGQYLDFSVTGDFTPTTLDYSLYYTNNGSTEVALRSSVDDFASNLALLSEAGLPGGDNTLVFDLSSLGALSGTTEFRLYFYNAPTAGNTFDDVRSSAADSSSDGLILNEVATTPEPASGVLLLTGLAGVAGLWHRRRSHSVHAGEATQA